MANSSWVRVIKILSKISNYFCLWKTQQKIVKHRAKVDRAYISNQYFCRKCYCNLLFTLLISSKVGPVSFCLGTHKRKMREPTIPWPLSSYNITRTLGNSEFSKKSREKFIFKAFISYVGKIPTFIHNIILLIKWHMWLNLHLTLVIRRDWRRDICCATV